MEGVHFCALPPPVTVPVAQQLGGLVFMWEGSRDLPGQSFGSPPSLPPPPFATDTYQRTAYSVRWFFSTWVGQRRQVGCIPAWRLVSLQALLIFGMSKQPYFSRPMV